MRIDGIRKDHLRFGFSPARECLRGMRVLLHPAQHAEQMPWVREARRRFSKESRSEIERFRFLFEPRAETFPFLWDEVRQDDFDSELMRLQTNLESYRDAVVIRLSERRLLDRSQLQRMRRPAWHRRAAAAYVQRHPQSAPMLERFLSTPSGSLRDFCEMLEAFHARVFLPAWEPIQERLHGDLAMRKSVLRDFGVTPLLRTLARDIAAQRTRTGASLVAGADDNAVGLDAGSTVVLTPSFFCWPAHELYVRHTAAGIACTIAYPIPPLTARASKLDDRDALATMCAALSDPLRLRVLELLNAREISTRELAAFLKLSEPVVSRHLRALLRAGLVAQRRSSYFVMYSVRRENVARVARALSFFA